MMSPKEEEKVSKSKKSKDSSSSKKQKVSVTKVKKDKGKEEKERKEGGGIVYTIPLGDAFHVPRTKRAKKAIKIVKDFLFQHTKAIDIKVDKKVNEEIWKSGIQKPPRRIKVRVSKEEGGIVKATLA
jgi:large subunit ribosomal protein L31e